MDIGNKLKVLRETNKLTQDELSLKLRLSRTTITNYENGKRTPDIETLYQICNFYNITLEEFFKEKDYKPKKAKSNKNIISATIVLIAAVVLLIISLINIITPKHNYGYDISNDELKVHNSNEISIVKFLSKETNNTYHIQIVENLKGDSFEYVAIKSKDIIIDLSMYYLIFGNKVSSNKDTQCYITLDCIEIYDSAFICELSDYDSKISYLSQPSKSKTIIEYYSYYINNEESEDVVISSLTKSRDEEFIIKNEDIFKNKYDSFNLNDDFDIKFSDMIGRKYLYADIEIKMKVKNKSSSKQSIALYKNNLDSNKYLITTYEFDLDNYKNNIFNFITYTFKNINLEDFLIDSKNELIIRYGSNSVFSSSWSNNNLKIKIGYKEIYDNKR